jgi:4a-hydroxytetrahydrobiopterin dehydratase
MWEEKENKLVKHFKFKDFKAALKFINQVGDLSEAQNHHPEIFNVYNKVSLSLTTHDAGNTITEKDLTLANSIDQLI